MNRYTNVSVHVHYAELPLWCFCLDLTLALEFQQFWRALKYLVILYNEKSDNRNLVVVVESVIHESRNDLGIPLCTVGLSKIKLRWDQSPVWVWEGCGRLSNRLFPQEHELVLQQQEHMISVCCPLNSCSFKCLQKIFVWVANQTLHQYNSVALPCWDRWHVPYLDLPWRQQPALLASQAQIGASYQLLSTF